MPWMRPHFLSDAFQVLFDLRVFDIGSFQEPVEAVVDACHGVAGVVVEAADLVHDGLSFFEQLLSGGGEAVLGIDFQGAVHPVQSVFVGVLAALEVCEVGQDVHDLGASGGEPVEELFGHHQIGFAECAGVPDVRGPFEPDAFVEDLFPEHGKREFRPPVGGVDSREFSDPGLALLAQVLPFEPAEQFQAVGKKSAGLRDEPPGQTGFLCFRPAAGDVSVEIVEEDVALPALPDACFIRDAVRAAHDGVQHGGAVLGRGFEALFAGFEIVVVAQACLQGLFVFHFSEMVQDFPGPSRFFFMKRLVGSYFLLYEGFGIDEVHDGDRGLLLSGADPQDIPFFGVASFQEFVDGPVSGGGDDQDVFRFFP